jgi:hypothetical protein
MPFALVLIGLMLIATGVQDTYVAMGSQLKKDFTGPQSFTMWAVAMIMLGMLGYIEQLRRLSWLFMFLVVLALFLSQGTDFLGKLQSSISKGPISPPHPTTPGTATAAAGVGSALKTITDSPATLLTPLAPVALGAKALELGGSLLNSFKGLFK